MTQADDTKGDEYRRETEETTKKYNRNKEQIKETEGDRRCDVNDESV